MPRLENVLVSHLDILVLADSEGRAARKAVKGDATDLSATGGRIDDDVRFGEGVEGAGVERRVGG